MKLATALVCMGGAINANLYNLLITALPSLPAQAGMLIPAMCFVAVCGFARASSWDVKAAADPAMPAIAKAP